MAAVKQEIAPQGSRCSPKAASLYVGDLHPEVKEEDLIVKFSSTVPVVSAHLCRCSSTGKSLCYGYVNFDSSFNASNALACLNHTELKGKTMRIMWFQKDQTQRRSGVGNLFVKNIGSSITSGCLERIFGPFGDILSCKVAEENGQSKGYGFVHFGSSQAALAACKALNGSLIDGKKLYVAKFINKTARTSMSEKHDSTNLYVKNLAEDVTEDILLKKFSTYGRVSSVLVARDDNGISKGFGFVNFFQPEDGRKAIEAMNGAMLGSKILFVGRCQTKTERSEILKDELKENFISGFKKSKWLNLYVKNLSESVDEARLREVFGCYGRITSAKVMRNEDEVSKGFGFVCFSSSEESQQAKRQLNGFWLDGKSLIVRVAERKEDRLKRLSLYFPKPLGQIPDSFLHGFHYPAQSQLPPKPGSMAYMPPFYMLGSQAFLPNISPYVPTHQTQPKQMAAAGGYEC